MAKVRSPIGGSVVLVFLTVAAAFGVVSEAAAQAHPGRVEAEVGGRKAALRVSNHRQYGAVNGDELLASVLGSGSVSGQFLRARLGTGDLVLEADSPFFLFGGRVFQLANSPYMWGGSFWVPVEFVTTWLPTYAGGRTADVALPESVPARRVDPTMRWNVVIDPGHGGRDPGTIGRRTEEKDLVLAISLALRDELRRTEMIQPFLTRETDVYIPHDDRSAYAVEQDGDLFVSIHANSVPSASSARGFETFFLGPARSEEAREVALRESRTPDVGDEGPGSIEDRIFILTGLDRTENITESRRFAGFVQNAMREARGRRVPDRGVKQGPWWVLLGALARMPSVIIEVGFVSNEGEEQYLASADGQREVAVAIASAIVAYRRDMLARFAAGPADGGRN